MMADSCEPLAVSWQLKVLNDDGGWQDVILSLTIKSQVLQNNYFMNGM